tara:strand:- start:184 stop:771 length:588 start_codon:yes stop_codon:yes gene_type:complete
MTAKIKLNAASGGGSFSLQAPSSSSNNRVFTLPDSADATLLTSTASLGKILQVVQGTRTSGFSSTSTSYVDLGLSASITPSTNSKILAVVTVQAYLQSDDNEGFGIKLIRTPSGGSDATVFTSASTSDVRGYTNFTGEHIRMYVRSPWDILDSSVGGNGSTAITYKVQVANVSSSTTEYSKDGNLSSITLWEVAA